jgi:hypothetical protein
MKTETRITITYLYPGAFFPETTSKKVPDTNFPKTIPADCYGFYFTKTEYVIGENGKEFIGESKQVGKTYLVGEAIHADNIPKIDRGQDTDILRQNIKNNSPTKRGIKCHTGNWQMEDEYSTCLSPSQFKFGKPGLYPNWNKRK